MIRPKVPAAEQQQHARNTAEDTGSMGRRTTAPIEYHSAAYQERLNEQERLNRKSRIASIFLTEQRKGNGPTRSPLTRGGEKERARERESERAREQESERGRERERERERERQRE